MSSVHKTHDLTAMPRGDTARGVNQCVAEELLRALDPDRAAAVLDIPCGKGEFVRALRGMLPVWDIVGADITVERQDTGLVRIDASTDGVRGLGRTFDAVTCISGVMEFHNTFGFFEQVRDVVRQDGVFVVTNDNLLSVRDRVLYFLFGRFGQYPFSVGSVQQTWQIVPLQNLMKALVDAGFEVERVRYVPVLAAHWLWLPIALPLHLLGRLYHEPEARPLLPPVSLLSKHYLLVCRPA